ncbi:hypothetical protein BGZ46_000713 [Entomortierella lignicola]|nr:hypothetical protein BGZ46_000713 [Entomortierella lignicola]
MWVIPDLIELHTGVDNLFSSVKVDANIGTGLERSLSSKQPKSRESTVNCLYYEIDGSVDLIVDIVRSPQCSDRGRKTEHEDRCWDMSVEALLKRYMSSTGSFELVKEYCFLNFYIDI